MIPRTLHFAWLNDDTPAPEAAEAIDTWRTHARQFAVRVWTRSDVAAQWGARMLETDLSLAVLSDLLRVHIVHEFGGVYLDCDIFAQNAAAGEVLDEVCAGCSLFGASFAGGSLSVDTVPMGAAAGLPGFYELARRPEHFISNWNRYLSASQLPPAILSGNWWNAPEAAPGVKAVHRRGLLRPHMPAGLARRRRPERPTIVIKTKQASDAYEAATSRAKAVLSGVADRIELIPTTGELAVEVGTDRGEYAAEILARFPGRLVCVDPWQATVDDIADPHTNRDRGADMAAAVARLAAAGSRASILRQRSIDAAATFSDGSIDYCYIDADHYHAAADLAAWWPKVKPGGIMAGHDFTGEWGPWIVRAVEEFAYWEGVTPLITRDFPASWFFVKP